MNKTLILAEKPSVARDIARVLKLNRKQNGFIEGNNHVVSWALGHLVTLQTPEKYHPRFKSWKLEDLPIIPKEFETEIIKKTSKQFFTIKNLIYRKDIKEIVIATDAGREGELVARWILDQANNRKPIKRLWISSVTDKAIRTGFNQLKDGRNYQSLYDSAVGRSISDWVVGINATRALTCKFNAELSCGRVQTPTLALIAKREEEIRDFKPQKYYGIEAIIDGITFTWHDKKNNDIKTFNKDYCDKVLSSIRHKEAKVINVNKSMKKAYAPKLYDLTELQRDANKIYNFSAKETLSIMQSLYERHKLLTYPRTDSRYLTTDIVQTLEERIHAINIYPYNEYSKKLLNKPIHPNKSFVDNSKVTDHHAIIPTEERPTLSKLNDRERKIYDLVIKRFLAVLYPPFIYEQMTVHIQINNEKFTAKGKNIKSLGWKEIYSNIDLDEEQDQQLPSVHEGDVLKVSSIKETSGETKPPAFFNEGTLLSVMENPVKYMETSNKELIKTIGETGGLGTVATRADIIEKLFDKFYIEKRGKDIITTSKGRQLLDLVPEELKSPILTAKWEQKLTLIEKGKLNKNDFIDEMKSYAKKVVGQIKASDSKFKHDNMTSKKCPECDKLLLEVTKKDVKMLVCQDRTCHYRKIISKQTNTRCPNCHKRLELFGEGEAQTFVCRCGYREKLSKFYDKKNKSRKGLSKHEVKKYLDKNNKESDVQVNSALQDALKNLNIKK